MRFLNDGDETVNRIPGDEGNPGCDLVERNGSEVPGAASAERLGTPDTGV